VVARPWPVESRRPRVHHLEAVAGRLPGERGRPAALQGPAVERCRGAIARHRPQRDDERGARAVIGKRRRRA